MSHVHTKGLYKDDLIQVSTQKKDIDTHYDFDKELGHGAFGKVYKVSEKHTGEERVCKEVSIGAMSPQEAEMMKAELDITKALDHPYVVKLYEYCQSPQMIYIIMELIPGGDVRDLIDSKKDQVDERHAAKFMRQHLMALEYCHGQGVLHKDIKPENMMLTIKNDPANAELKVIDFGLAQAVTDRTKEDMGVIAGTPPYMAPELITEKPFGEAVDLWSIGVSNWNLLTNTFPFGDMPDYNGDIQAIKRVIAAGDCDFNVPEWEHRSKYAQDFTKKLLAVNPHERMTSTEALEHPWLEKYAPMDRHGISSDIAHGLAGFSDAPHFVQACCLIVATQLSDKEMESIRKDFTSLDEHGEGEIPVEVLKEALLSKQWFWSRDEEYAEKVADHADLNGDGYVGFSEFAAASIHDQLKGECVCDRAFDIFDHDGDGLIDFNDIQLVLEKPHVKEFEAESGIDYLDLVRPLAGGGQIDFGGFRKMLVDAAPPHAAKEAALDSEDEDDPPVKSGGGLFGMCSPCSAR
eukprot:gnl/MRDRNA2_/MRDRNA2_19786_c0_seq1.p1 gnl/MRDRNA2_/MRDRNA2_19786_c0~~gnl/MRDRNA2_/MRDRNA2_19786_c0_seq1.p1  ORF type:complete len:519 (+),score=116.51 gnl/MRDRNA2_/MRDRNA2_19786_c0_seq1:94-1650(+)